MSEVRARQPARAGYSHGAHLPGGGMGSLRLRDVVAVAAWVVRFSRGDGRCGAWGSSR